MRKAEGSSATPKVEKVMDGRVWARKKVQRWGRGVARNLVQVKGWEVADQSGENSKTTTGGEGS